MAFTSSGIDWSAAWKGQSAIAGGEDTGRMGIGTDFEET